MNRRTLLKRGLAAAASLGAGGSVLASRVAPVVQKAVESSPRYLWDPERQLMTERVREGVYRVMSMTEAP